MKFFATFHCVPGLDNELLLAISEIIEKKIKAEVEPLKLDIQQNNC